MARRRWFDAGFIAVWMVVWTAAIIVAVWLLGSAALGGEVAAAVFLAVWVCAAGFGLVSAGRRLVSVLMPGREARRPDGRRWDDGFDPPPGPQDGSDPEGAAGPLPRSRGKG